MAAQICKPEAQARNTSNKATAELERQLQECRAALERETENKHNLLADRAKLESAWDEERKHAAEGKQQVSLSIALLF